VAFDPSEFPVQAAPFDQRLENFGSRVKGGQARVVAIGSSTTAGEGGIAPYPQRLLADLRIKFPNVGIEVINRGVGGEDAPLELKRLKDALRKWFHASQMRSKLVQVFRNSQEPELQEALHALENLGAAAEKEAIARAKLVDADCYKRNVSAAGVGPYSGCALTFLLCSKEFKDADSIRAFVGLDLRVEDSGKKKGKRFITKRGDRILRHAVTCAARGLLNSKLGKPMNEELKAKGRKHAERLVIASRKILRTAFALDKQKTTFDPQKFKWGLDTKT